MFQSTFFKQAILCLCFLIQINGIFRTPSPSPLNLQENVYRKAFPLKGFLGGSHNDTQLLVALRGTSITTRPNSLPRHRTSELLYLSSLLLCLSSDIEVNPGPYTPKYPCNICEKAAKWGQQAIQCDGCDCGTTNIVSPCRRLCMTHSQTPVQHGYAATVGFPIGKAHCSETQI